MGLIALKSRNMNEISPAFTEIIKHNGAPININCDQEFNTKSIHTIADRHHIHFFFSQNKQANKNGIVERANRTIASLLVKAMSTGYSWPILLPQVLKNYNSTPSSRQAGATPNELYDKTRIDIMMPTEVKDNFRVDDLVRIKADQTAAFRKGTAVQNSVNRHKVVGREGINLLLEGYGNKRFKPYQLTKTKKVEYFGTLKSHSNPKEQKKPQLDRLLARENYNKQQRAQFRIDAAQELPKTRKIQKNYNEDLMIDSQVRDYLKQKHKKIILLTAEQKRRKEFLKGLESLDF